MNTTDFLETTKSIDTKNSNNTELLNNFLKSSSTIDSGAESRNAILKTLTSFLNGSYDTDTNYTYAKKEVLENFLKDKGISIHTDKDYEKTLKQALESEIYQKSPFGEVNLSNLIYYTIGDTIKSKDLKDILKDTELLNKSGINEDLYKDLLMSLMDIESDEIKGFSNFLAQSQVLNRTKLQSIKVDLEIIRTNFTIDKEILNAEIKREDLVRSDNYLFGRNKAKINRERLQKVSQYLAKMEGIRSIVRANNIIETSEEESGYVVPTWADLKSRITIDMHVRQSNSIIRKKAKHTTGMADLVKSNKVTKALVDILTPTTDSNWTGEKTGFHSYGASPSTITKLRDATVFNTLDKNSSNYLEEETTYYKSIEKDLLKTFDEDGYVHYQVNRGATPLFIKSIILSGIKVPKSIVSLRHGDNIGVNRDSAVKWAFNHAVYNMSIKALMDRTPDFRQNMYTGLFVLTDNNMAQERSSFYDMVNNLGNGYSDDWVINLHRNSTSTEIAKAYDSFKKIVDTYYVRMEGITIPGATIASYELPFLNRKIKKVTSSFTEAHKATINFTLDETGAILRHFDLLTGTFSQQEGQEAHNQYARTYFPISFNHNNSKLDLVVTYNDFRIGKDFKTDTTIRSNYLPAQQDRVSGDKNVTNSNGRKYIGDKDSYRQFILEDVKILGFSGGLQFQRESANKISLPVDIIFKRITTVDNNTSA